MTVRQQSGKGQKKKPDVKTASLKPKQDAPRRVMETRSLGAILPSITKPAFQKRPVSLMRLFLDWPEIVGPRLARLTEPRKVVQGTLTIACSGGLALELQHLAPQLIDTINAHCGHRGALTPRTFTMPGRFVERLKIIQDPTLARHAVSPRRSPPEPVHLAGSKESPLEDVLARLGSYIRLKSEP